MNHEHAAPAGREDAPRMPLPVQPQRPCRAEIVTIGCFCAGLSTANGCFAPVDVDTAVLSALVRADDEPAIGSGNIVVSYTNAARRPAQWMLVWQRAGLPVPNVLSTETEPGATGTMTLGTPITELSLGSLEPNHIGIIIGHGESDVLRLPYRGPLLRSGKDFKEGDIISFTLRNTAEGDYTVDVHVTAGG